MIRFDFTHPQADPFPPSIVDILRHLYVKERRFEENWHFHDALDVFQGELQMLLSDLLSPLCNPIDQHPKLPFALFLWLFSLFLQAQQNDRKEFQWEEDEPD